MPCSALACPAPAPALSCPLSFSLYEKSIFIVSIERRDSPGKARHDTGRACLAVGLACLALPWLALACLAPAPALSCPLSFSLNEKIRFILFIERRDFPSKAGHDTGRACLALALACSALHWLALPRPHALPCPLTFSLNEKSLYIGSIEKRETPRGKARHDTGKACLGLPCPCPLPCLAVSLLPYT